MLVASPPTIDSTTPLPLAWATYKDWRGSLPQRRRTGLTSPVCTGGGTDSQHRRHPCSKLWSSPIRSMGCVALMVELGMGMGMEHRRTTHGGIGDGAGGRVVGGNTGFRVGELARGRKRWRGWGKCT